MANDLGFTGRYHDGFTGLLDFRFRQYSARMGRFVSRDDHYGDGMLLYRAYFVPNGTDPTGHSPNPIIGGTLVGGPLGSDPADYLRGWCFLNVFTDRQFGIDFTLGVNSLGGRVNGVISCLPRGFLTPPIGGGGGTRSGTGGGSGGSDRSSPPTLSQKEANLIRTGFQDSVAGRREAIGKAISLYWNYTVHGGQYSGKEWVGLVYRQGGSIFTTRGYLGDETSASLYSPLSDVPDGATVVGYWHTHPTMDMLSAQDVHNVAIRYVWPCTSNTIGGAECPDPAALGRRTIRFEGGYLAGPSGRIFGYEPANTSQAMRDLNGSSASQTPTGTVNPW